MGFFLFFFLLEIAPKYGTHFGIAEKQNDEGNEEVQERVVDDIGLKLNVKIRKQSPKANHWLFHDLGVKINHYKSLQIRFLDKAGTLTNDAFIYTRSKSSLLSFDKAS